MLFERGTKLYSYEVRSESGENVAYVNYLGAPIIPSIVFHPEVMVRVIDLLIENPNISRIVLVQQRNYNYNSEQVAILSEIAYIYNYLLKQERVLSIEKLSGRDKNAVGIRYEFMNFFMQLLREDPLLAYHKIRHKLVENRKKNDNNKKA